MAITVVQTATGGPVNDAVATFGGACTTGNIVLVIAGLDGATQTLSITNNNTAVTWNNVFSTRHAGPTSPLLAIYWGTVGASGPTTVTANSSSGNSTQLRCIEVSGLAASPLDTGIFSSNDDDTNPYDLASAITPSQADVILFGGQMGASTYNTPTLDGNFTGGAGGQMIAGYRIVSAIAAYGMQNGAANNISSVIGLAAFKMAAAGGGQPTIRRFGGVSHAAGRVPVPGVQTYSPASIAQAARFARQVESLRRAA